MRKIKFLKIFIILLQCSMSTHADSKINVTVVIEWGWGKRVNWDGIMSIDGGRFLKVEEYKMEAGERGVFDVSPTKFRVNSLTAGLVDGVIIQLEGNKESTVTIDILDKKINFKLKDVLIRERFFSANSQNAKIRIKRHPKDQMQLVPVSSDLVLNPNEKFSLDAFINPIDLAHDETGFKKKIVVQLNRKKLINLTKRFSKNPEEEVCAKTIASKLNEIQNQVTATSFDGMALPDRKKIKYHSINYSRFKTKISLNAPETEGVYELHASVEGSMIHDCIQFVVIEKESPISKPNKLEKTLIQKIDVTDTKNPVINHLDGEGSKVLTLPLGKFKATSTSGKSLGMNQREKNHMGWFAYKLKVKKVQAPHVLEMDFPDDRQQTVGVSILEKNIKGKIGVGQLDSGFFSGGEFFNANNIQKHKIIFWPRTQEPIVLITNRIEGSAAVIGEMRLYEIAKSLPDRSVPLQKRKAQQRLLGIYYEEPKVVENFGGPDALGGGRSTTDWNTFYNAGMHMVDYLKYTGQNSILIQSHGYLSTLYPTQLTQHAHRYDNGLTVLDGGDPFQKDILELYFRLFERENLFLIPSLNFEQTIPALEQQRVENKYGIAEIDMVSNEGKLPPSLNNKGRSGLAPWYDPVHPKVQQEILRSVEEVVERYKSFGSFMGISLQSRGLSFIQYPGLDYGYGEYSIKKFQEEMGIRIPMTGRSTNKYRKIYNWIIKNKKEEWVSWRVDKIHELMIKVRNIITKASPESLLFVSYMNTFQSILVSDNVLKWHAQNKPMLELFRVKGLDPTKYIDEHNIIVTRPVRIGPVSRYLQRDGVKGMIRKDLQTMQEVNDLYINGSKTGILNFMEYLETSVKDFDRVSWFPVRTWLVNTGTPAGRNNLERFSKWIAELNPATIFDGGWQAPMGREEEIYEFSREFLSLPRVKFSKQKINEFVYLRQANTRDQRFFYLVNTSKKNVIVNLVFNSKSMIKHLGTNNTELKKSMSITLKGFGLQSFSTGLETKIDIINVL